MGEDPEESSRSADGPAEEPAAPTPDGGAAASVGIPEAVLPTFEEAEDDSPQLEPGVLPTFEEPAIGEKVLPVFEEPPAFERGVLPVFEEPEEALIPDPTAAEPSWTDTEDYRPKDEDFGIHGPEYDEEMPLTDHIEEMIKRLAVVVVVAGSVSLVTFPFTPEIINFLWYSILPGGEVAQPRVYGPLEFLLTRIKVASLVGLVVALPIVVYETYAFMRPGLYQHERKYYLAAIPTSLVLAIVGVAFAYFIVLPAIFTYFLTYSQEAGEIAFALAQTFDLMLILMGYLAIVFQIPLFMMLAIMMGLTTRRWMAEKRLYFWGAFLGIAFLSSPDPTGMAPIIIALTMVGLFEGTIALLKWVGK